MEKPFAKSLMTKAWMTKALMIEALARDRRVRA
jgi:hypothetical protein